LRVVVVTDWLGEVEVMADQAAALVVDQSRTMRNPVHMVDKSTHMHTSRFVLFLSNYPAPLFPVVGCYHRQ
jgi:hypothetical protein